MFRLGTRCYLVFRNFSTKIDEIGQLVKVSNTGICIFSVFPQLYNKASEKLVRICFPRGIVLSSDCFLQKNKVVVFMKGIPEEPRCGFSNAVVQILRMHGVTYDAHDVLQDEELRQGKLTQTCVFDQEQLRQ